MGASPRDLSVIAIRGVPEVRSGDDLADFLWSAMGREGLTLRDGVGAVVTVKAGGRSQTGYVKAGTSYCSQSELRCLPMKRYQYTGGSCSKADPHSDGKSYAQLTLVLLASAALLLRARRRTRTS